MNLTDPLGFFRGGDRRGFVPAEFNVPDLNHVDELGTYTATTKTDNADDGIEIRSGVAESGDDAGWYFVEFTKPFPAGTTPVVLVTSVEREGEFATGEYSAPEHDVGSVPDLSVHQPSIGEPSIGAPPGIDDVDLSSISLSGVDLSAAGDIPSASISASGVGTPSIGDVDLDPGIGVDGIDVDIGAHGVSPPEIDVDMVLDRLDLPAVDLPTLEDVAPPGMSGPGEMFVYHSFEEDFRQAARDQGRESYNRWENTVSDHIPGLQANLDGRILDLWDGYCTQVWGYGSSRKRGGAGTVEAVFGWMGEQIDTAIEELIMEGDGKFEDLVDETGTSLQDYSDDLDAELDRWVDDDLFDALDNLAVSIIDGDANSAGVNEVFQQIEETVNDEILFGDNGIVTEIERMADEIDSEMADFSAEVEAHFDDVNDVLFEIEGMVNDELESITINLEDRVADINTALEDVVADTNTGFEDLSESTENSIADLAAAVEDQLEDQRAAVEDQLGTQRDDVQAAFDRLVDEIEGVDGDGLAEAIQTALEEQNAEVESALVDLHDAVDDELAAVAEDANDGLEQLSTDLQALLDAFNEDVLTSYGQLTGLAQSSLNNSQRLLYDSIGAPEGQLLTPVPIRDSDATGFEFLGYEGGMTIHWLAIAETDEGVIGRDPEDLVDERVGEIRDELKEEIKRDLRDELGM